MSNSVPQTSLGADIVSYVRYQLHGRRGLIAAGVGLGIPALWLGWPWLVAAGLAPLLIAVAPCAIMCALGLCAMRGTSNANTGQASCCEQSQSSNEALTPTSAKAVTTETQMSQMAATCNQMMQAMLPNQEKPAGQENQPDKG